MAGRLYVDEIRDTVGAGSPSFPNGLDVAELVDPIGAEGEVLTVQADGSILASARIPLVVGGITDRSDPAEIGAALMAALAPLTFVAPLAIMFFISRLDGTYPSVVRAYDDTGLAWEFAEMTDLGGATGAGSILFWGLSWYDNS